MTANEPVMDTKALALIDYWLAQVIDAEQRGYERAEADMAAAWRTMTYPVARPDAYRRELIYRGLQAAAKGERQDAIEHERAFVARAHNTRSAQRNDVEQATVRLYPPPQQQWRAA